MSLLKKKELGQFNTTRVDYILQAFEQHVKGKDVIDPFCGDRDLLNWAEHNNARSLIGLDVDPSVEPDDCVDSFTDPYDYSGLFILANPPYLAKNKSEDKEIFNKFNTDDLYKAAIQTFKDCEEGVLIVPVNFLSSKEAKTRNWFFSQFRITKCILFEEQVFDDTTSTVISFHFEKGENAPFILTCSPSGKEIPVFLNPEHTYLFGEGFFNFLGDATGVRRLVLGDSPPQSKLYLRALDGGSADNRIKLEIIDEPYYGKQSDRSKASIVLDIDLTVEQQEELCRLFNKHLEEFREEYHSLFLSNFRESSSLYARKRIGFTQAYKLIGALTKKIS